MSTCTFGDIGLMQAEGRATQIGRKKNTYQARNNPKNNTHAYITENRPEPVEGSKKITENTSRSPSPSSSPNLKTQSKHTDRVGLRDPELDCRHDHRPSGSRHIDADHAGMDPGY